MTLSTNELIERITKCLQEMSGDDLCEFYNKKFGDGMEYLGDDLFCQDDNENENEN